MTADPGVVEAFEALLGTRAMAADLRVRLAAELDYFDPERRPSAENLVDYLALRSTDLRDVQRTLAHLGLSSLGRSEAHVLATLDAVLARLADDLDQRDDPRLHDLGRLGPSAPEGEQRLIRNTADVLGDLDTEQDVRVMVTLPSEAADDAELVDRLVNAGMTVARINCAHDDPEAWRRMASHVRAAADRHGRRVPISFDLAGPKLRTGDFVPASAVVKVQPERDTVGRTTRRARVRFVAGDSPSATSDLVEVAAPVDLVRGASPGDVIYLEDARGRKRRFDVVTAFGPSVEATTDRTSYLTPGVVLHLEREGSLVASGPIGTLPPRSGRIALAAGDRIELRVGDDAGRRGDSATAAVIYVDVPELFGAVVPGQRVLFDDGTIEGVAVDATTDRIIIEIRHPGRAVLKPEKGINLPDTDLAIVAPTVDDIRALEAIADNADLVALSFVSSADDVDRLVAHLHRLDRVDVGIVLKIEHRAAFERLPEILLRALRHRRVAVMVARGDLAIEVGYERLAEVQEEILLMCEAAHVPVIWATQVLESLAKRGAPTRAEITDVAWGSRTECVMLNKGPFVPHAIESLTDIVVRMHGHLDKRTPMLRSLSIAARFVHAPSSVPSPSQGGSRFGSPLAPKSIFPGVL